MTFILIQVTGDNLLLGKMPESVGLFVFGIILIAFAVGLRWLLNRKQEETEPDEINK